MKRMRTVADSDSATSESDVENSYNTDNEVETDSASESDSDNVDDTSSEVERQPYLIRAKPTALNLENVLTELYRLIGNNKKQSKWNKSRIKNIPILQPKSSRKRTKSSTKSAKNVDNTEMNDGSMDWLKLETKAKHNS
ncbi:Hypothetical predicted protein [Paramuricea clavata]|uniref:Uncharacterized protein n=1 Tax=Paramuricea clavata TaxID=317549 RepID=A0A6S7I9J8_PARCT|nr:Hypothetical predicted protein [Paramuricea clavata]